MQGILRTLSERRSHLACGLSTIALFIVAGMAIALLVGCSVAQEAIGKRHEYAAEIVDKETNDAAKLLKRETDRLFWDVEYRLRNDAITHKAKVKGIESAFATELSAIVEPDIQSKTVDATVAYRDALEAENADYRAKVAGNVSWAEGEARTIWEEHDGRLTRAQAIAELSASADREAKSRMDVIEGIRTSASLQSIIDTIRDLAGDYLPATAP